MLPYLENTEMYLKQCLKWFSLKFSNDFEELRVRPLKRKSLNQNIFIIIRIVKIKSSLPFWSVLITNEKGRGKDKGSG